MSVFSEQGPAAQWRHGYRYFCRKRCHLNRSGWTGISCTIWNARPKGGIGMRTSSMLLHTDCRVGISLLHLVQKWAVTYPSIEMLLHASYKNRNRIVGYHKITNRPFHLPSQISNIFTETPCSSSTASPSAQPATPAFQQHSSVFPSSVSTG